MTRTIVVLIAALSGGCLNLDALQACTHKVCPSSQVCRDGTCVPAPSSDDGGAPADLAGTQTDMAQPPPGCASGLPRPVSAKVVGCLGAWGTGGPATLCAAGWPLCATNSAGAACQANLPSTEFYVSAATQGQPSPSPWGPSATCGWAGIMASGSLRGLGSCGNGVPGLNGPPSVTPCSNFGLTVSCWNAGDPLPYAVVTCAWSQASDADLSGAQNLALDRISTLHLSVPIR